MINTDKYEGHTEDIGRWQMMGRSLPVWANDRDEQLVRDAVYLLEEVKRLRKNIEGYKAIWDYLDPKGYAWQEEEFVALLKEHGFETGDD